MNWSNRLQERGSALCIGLDPVESRLPPGETLSSFCRGVIEVTAESAACFKPNAAFFERHGSSGFDALAEVMEAARTAGVPIILDAKRGDIGSTARLYAEAYLGDGDLRADALTVSAALGIDTLEPFLELARANDRGIFVLLRTSNPGAAMFQEAMEPGLVDFLRSEPNAGAVVGATDPEAGRRLREALPDTLFLVPGFGAQGGADLVPFFDGQGRGAVVNSSRGIIYAGASSGNWCEKWQAAVQAAANEAVRTIERARAK